MRIISGIYSGRVLSSKIPEGTRPTTDMAREALFNSLNNIITFENIRVLDLFAGTGAIGIEALSRGALLSVFIESGFKQIQTIKSNLEILKINSSQAKIIKRKVLDFLTSTKDEEKYDLIFADPPYKLNEYSSILEIISDKKILNLEGLIVLEMTDAKIPAIPESMEVFKEKKYGTTKFLFIREKK